MMEFTRDEFNRLIILLHFQASQHCKSAEFSKPIWDLFDYLFEAYANKDKILHIGIKD